MSFALRNIGRPAQFADAHLERNPRAVEDLAKMSAQVCPVSGLAVSCPRVFFTSVVAARILSMSALASFSTVSRCFMFLRLDSKRV